MRIRLLISRLRGVAFGTRRRAWLTVCLSVVMLAVIGAGGLYWYVVSGGLIARKDPSALESFVARHLVDISIPADAKAMRNPLSVSRDGTDVAAGGALYRQNCQSCHGYDGSGRTQAGLGLYPPAADLRRSDTARRTDGAIFYLIRNGIRNTGMPGWQMTDRQTWQLVSFIRNLPPVAPAHFGQVASVTGGRGGYVGSAACQSCHRQVYDRWKQTLMANVVRDPHEHPDAVLADFSKPNPNVNFTPDQVAFVYGSKWKQRYFKKVGDDYFPFPAQWDVKHKQWKPYFVKEDWWAHYYPPDNFRRPTGPTCDGCHSVNYDTQTRQVTEWNVGCEKCHGPGGEHVKNPSAANVINPARLDYVQANDVCIQCHSQGRPRAAPSDGKYYDWPVGYHVGLKLDNFWTLEEHILGQTTFTHFADGTAHKNRMQGNDFVTSLMYTHGVACYTCHDSHGTSNDALLRKPAAVLCLDCHGPKSANGPREATIELHTHHKAGSSGSECIACHMPQIAQTLGDVKVRSHTFRFVSPAATSRSKVPNACNVCHSDKTPDWAAEALKSWADRSPWRVAQ